MKYKWLNKNHNQKLIIFFNGWGCDEIPLNHLDFEENDVLMCYDYTILELDSNTITEIKNYASYSIVAWSFGVWVGQYICNQHQLNPQYSVAINGTSKPVDAKLGIPEAIVFGTLNNLTERNLMKFQRRMLGGGEAWKSFENNKPQRDFSEQKYELKSLTEHFMLDLSDNIIYNKAIIGNEDLIFNPDNQRAYWKDKVKINEISAPHFCFYNYNTWNEILL